MTSIDSDDPITSGILYISEGVDDVMNILSVETRQILADVELSEPEFSKDVNTLSVIIFLGLVRLLNVYIVA